MKENKFITENLVSKGEMEIFCEWYACPRCESDIAGDYVFCPDCGLELRPKTFEEWWTDLGRRGNEAAKELCREAWKYGKIEKEQTE